MNRVVTFGDYLHRAMLRDPRIWIAAAAIVALNLPFGYWRAGQRKFSRTWFVAVHAPVPLAVGMRWAAGIPFRLVLLPVFVGAFFGGQWLGARMRRRRLPDIATGRDSRAPSANPRQGG